MPNYLFEATWQPDGILRVVRPYPDSPASDLLQPDDIIMEIDGEPAQRLPLRPLFVPQQDGYRYTVLRDGQTLTIDVPTGQMTPTLLRKRMTSVVIALGTWLVGILIVLYATPSNRDAWHVGLVTLGLAVALAAAEAALYGVPLTWLASDPFLPFLAVAFAQLAFLPRRGQPSAAERRVFEFLYGVAFLLGLISLIEILYLTLRRTSVELLLGFSLSDVILLVLGLGLILNPLILLGRFFRMRPSYQRQQVGILLIATLLAISPLVLLTILPESLADAPLLPWEISLLFLLINPAAYGYVIFRRRYLELDIFATKTILVVVLILLLLLTFAGTLYLFKQQPFLPIAEPFTSTLSFSLALAGVAAAGSPFRHAAKLVIYGKSATNEEHLTRLTETLSADPQFDTLRSVFQELLGLLQVRRAALFLAGRDNHLQLFTSSLDRHVPPLPADLLPLLPSRPIIRATVDNETDAIAALFDCYPWVEAVVPLVSRRALVGVILLGPQVPDAYFNAEEVRFMKQAADAMSVATEASRLFEASLAMSQTLLQVRDQERTQLAAEIHDEPLQRISMVTSALERLVQQETAADCQVRATVSQQCKELLLVAEQVRSICAGLRPPILSQGIQWAVQEVVYEFRRATHLDVRVDVAVPAACQIPGTTTKATYHVMVEALNNVRKHAQATTVWVRLVLTDGILCLSVEDNGVGTAATRLSLADLVRAHHFGMVGMHEWVNLAKGALSIEAREGGGTKVVATFPLKPDNRSESIDMTNQDTYLNVENLTKIYPSNSEPAVDGVSMAVRPGEIVALLGPNGAGKTTTVKMIAGLIIPSAGRVRVMGHDVTRERTAAVRHIGAVLEGARNLYWRLPAWENLLYFGRLRAVPPDLLQERADMLLRLMDLHDRKNQEVRHFSRGMQQKLAIAASLLHDPDILLLDEPTLGLDLQAARKVEETIRQLARDQGKAIVLTTHTMPLAEKLADRIFVIHRGRQVAYDSTQRLLERYDGHRETTEIRITGTLPESLLAEIQELYPDLTASADADDTLLLWSAPDQSDVIYLLEFLDRHGATILNVRRRQATLEEVFLALTDAETTK